VIEIRALDPSPQTLWCLARRIRETGNDAGVRATAAKFIEIEPRGNLRKRGGKSPDYAGAFMSTFT
jgi:hypothetical protein